MSAFDAKLSGGHASKPLTGQPIPLIESALHVRSIVVQSQLASAKRVLHLMLEDMEQAEESYKPTNFWESGLQSIIADLNTRGFETFRDHVSANRFYVPTYRNLGWIKRLSRFATLITAIDHARPRSRFKERLQLLATGEAEAFQDYRLFRAGDSLGGLDLSKISEHDVGGGERFSFDGARLSRSMLNYLRGLTFLKKYTSTTNLLSILEIGGGYGTLGEILLKAQSGSFYVNVDIPPVAAVATYYLQQVFGQNAVWTYEQSRSLSSIDLNDIKQKYSAAVLCPWQLPRIKGKVDLFANFISFQEMEPHVVRNYAALVQRHSPKHILLRNSVAGMEVAAAVGDLGVLKPTTTDDIISYFEEFELTARDSLAFGYEILGETFRSEVILMTRKSSGDEASGVPGPP